MPEQQNFWLINCPRCSPIWPVSSDQQWPGDHCMPGWGWCWLWTCSSHLQDLLHCSGAPLCFPAKRTSLPHSSIHLSSVKIESVLLNRSKLLKTILLISFVLSKQGAPLPLCPGLDAVTWWSDLACRDSTTPTLISFGSEESILKYELGRHQQLYYSLQYINYKRYNNNDKHKWALGLH